MALRTIARLTSACLLLGLLGGMGNGQAQAEDDATVRAQQRRELVAHELHAWLQQNPTDSAVYRRLYGLLQMQILGEVVDQEAGNPEETARAMAALEIQVRELAEAWAKNAPNEPDALLALAACQTSAQQREQIVTTAARRFPDNLYAHQMLAYTLGRQSPRSGAAVLDRYLVQHPDSREAFVALLVYCQGIEDHDRVRAAVARWLEHQPDDPLALRTRLELFASELAPAEITRDLDLLVDQQQVDGHTQLELCAVALRRNLFELGKSCSQRALARADVKAELALSSKAHRYIVWSSVLLGDWQVATEELAALGSAEPGLRISMAKSLHRLQRCSDANRLLAPLDNPELTKQQWEQILEIRTSCGDQQAGYDLWRHRLEMADANELAAILRQIGEHVPAKELFSIMLRRLAQARDRKPLLDALVPYLIGRAGDQMTNQQPLLEAWAEQKGSHQDEPSLPWLLEDLVGAVYGSNRFSGGDNLTVDVLAEKLLQPVGAQYQIDPRIAGHRCTVFLTNAAWPQYLDAICAIAGCTWQVRGSTPPLVELTARELEHRTVSIAVDNAPAEPALRQLAEAAGLRASLDPLTGITGRADLHLVNIEWPTALDLVCRQLGCRWQISPSDPTLLEITNGVVQE